MDLSELRRNYRKKSFSRSDLLMNPYEQFEKWFDEALNAEVLEPNAFSLATVSDGVPSLRTVLLKFFDERGFVFYTNYGSKKAQDISKNNNVALLFPWLDLERQVKIIGKVEPVSTAESMRYFASRPRGSQLGAWISHQSQVISSRSLLLQKLDEMKRKFAGGEVPLPSFWGGYRVVPTEFEFWQGRQNRIHDRFSYKLYTNLTWNIERLAP